MKISFIMLIVCLFGISSSSAQKYTPMLADSNKWYINNSGYGYSDDINRYDYDQNSMYYTRGDTLANSIEYKRLYYSGGGMGHDCLGKFDARHYQGLIREDTAEKKVYIWPRDSANEWVLYDFDVKLSDTLFLKFTDAGGLDLYYELASGKKYMVSSISKDSANRLKIKLTYNGPSACYAYLILTWIEGVGSLRSPLYFTAPADFIVGRMCGERGQSVTKLVCAYANDKVVFGDSTKAKVYDHYTNITPPNPSSNTFSLSQNGWQMHLRAKKVINNPIKAILYDLQGQAVGTFTIPAGIETFDYDYSYLPAGLYLLHMGEDNGEQLFKIERL